MKVSEVIDILNRKYKPDDDLVFAWWIQKSFSEAKDLTSEEWAAAADYMEDMDWARTHEELCWVLGDWNNRVKNNRRDYDSPLPRQ